MNTLPVETSALYTGPSWTRWLLRLAAVVILGYCLLRLGGALFRPAVTPVEAEGLVPASSPKAGPDRESSAPKADASARNKDQAAEPVRVPVSSGGYSYGWTPKTTYRFQYHKAIQVTAIHADGKKAPVRSTEINGVLVLDVETLESNGVATAAMRFDHAEPQLPAARLLDPSIQEDDERSRYMALAIRDSFKEARWRVVLGADGRVRILSRTPADWNEGLKKIEQAGKWRRKSVFPIYGLLEKELKFGGTGDGTDEDLFAALGDPGMVRPASSGWEALHPRRRMAAPKKLEFGKVELMLSRERTPVEGQEEPFEILGLDPGVPPVKIFAGKVEPLVGRAVFDEQVKMLDQLDEKYRASQRLECAGQEVSQSVEVTYRLHRLAPPIREARAEEETPAP